MNSDVMPVGHLTQDQVRAVMGASAAAPSIRNARPWRLECTSTAIELRAELPFAVTSTDPDHREFLLSCGAALLNVRAAIKALGVHPAVRLMPDENQPDLLAVVHPQGWFPATPADVALAAAIPRHRTHHQTLAPDGIPVAMVNRLRQAARVEQTWLAILAPDQLRTLHLGHLDGGHQPEEGAGMAGGHAHSSDCPDHMIAVIGSFHDAPLAWLQSGQGMQRVLLTATTAGLSTSFLSQVVRVPPARKHLRRLIGGGLWPQTVLRLECADPSPAIRSGSARGAHDTVTGALPRTVNH